MHQELWANYQQLYILDKTILDKIMKLYFNKTDSVPYSELITYTQLNPIPATLRLSLNTVLPETVYARNLAGENFIELRFNKETKKLYEITIVAIQEDTVNIGIDDWVVGDEFYECFIEDESELDISKPIRILRSNKSICFFWNEPSKMYPISKNCILGLNSDKKLSSVLFVNISNELIYEILGF